MILLTRLNRVPLALNTALIEHIDVTPDTVITLTTGEVLRVRESSEEVIRRVIESRRQIAASDGLPTGHREEFDAATRPGADFTRKPVSELPAALLKGCNCRIRLGILHPTEDGA